MIRLEDKMLLYHGSFVEVREVDLDKCRKGKDFGCGFYVTSSYEQARSFVPLSINKQINAGSLPESCNTGYISMLEDYSSETGLLFDHVLFQFTSSPAYKMLFDYSTGLWMEGPDYLREIFKETL